MSSIKENRCKTKGSQPLANILILMTFLTPPSFAISGEVNSSLKCEVKKQVILKMNEATPEIYDGHKEGITTGDSIEISLVKSSDELKTTLLGGDSNFSLFLEQHNAPFPLSSISISDEEGTLLLSEGDISERLIFLTKNKIFLDSTYAQFSLSRYHKDDWSGTVTLPGAHIIGLDCTMYGAFNKIIDNMIKLCSTVRQCRETLP